MPNPDVRRRAAATPSLEIIRGSLLVVLTSFPDPPSSASMLRGLASTLDGQGAAHAAPLTFHGRVQQGGGPAVAVPYQELVSWARENGEGRTGLGQSMERIVDFPEFQGLRQRLEAGAASPEGLGANPDCRVGIGIEGKGYLGLPSGEVFELERDPTSRLPASLGAHSMRAGMDGALSRLTLVPNDSQADSRAGASPR